MRNWSDVKTRFSTENETKVRDEILSHVSATKASPVASALRKSTAPRKIRGHDQGKRLDSIDGREGFARNLQICRSE